MLEALRHKVRRARELGPLDAARWALARAEGAAWERWFRGDTRRAFDREAYAGKVESIPYEPLPWYLLRRAIGALALTESDVFLDYGSGMGRALLMAARHPARRVVGVEFLAPLAEVARENLAAARPRLRSPVEVIVADAASWEVADDVTVAFLFNPFVGSVMAAAQARLAASLERRPRPLRVLYAHADDQPDLFAGCGWLHLQQRVDVGIFKGMNVALYTN
jgi:SAM-dependent methyltransferase